MPKWPKCNFRQSGCCPKAQGGVNSEAGELLDGKKAAEVEPALKSRNCVIHDESSNSTKHHSEDKTLREGKSLSKQILRLDRN